MNNSISAKTGIVIPAKAGISFAERRIRRLRVRAKRFRLSPEWRYFLSLRTIPNLAVSENIKNRHSGESRNLLPSHSCEGRNLYAEGGNCKLQELQLPAALRRRRFLPSQEWDGGCRRNFGLEPPHR
ncbi:MAG: hypothetical protein ACR2QC_04620 [Gammaproteobacteria bacterium]